MFSEIVVREFKNIVRVILKDVEFDSIDFVIRHDDDGNDSCGAIVYFDSKEVDFPEVLKTPEFLKYFHDSNRRLYHPENPSWYNFFYWYFFHVMKLPQKDMEVVWTAIGIREILEF